MIYHGSTIPNLKYIEPKESTQKGQYVYGTPNLVYAAIFSIIQKTDKPCPPKFGWPDTGIYLAERFENQFQSLQNTKVSIYILDERNFANFDNHSAGNNIEKRAKGPQKVLQEIKIPNILDFLNQNNVTLYEYKDRAKVGIPLTDKYLPPAILKTYLWKIEGRTEEDYARGRQHIEAYGKQLPHYKGILDAYAQILNFLSDEVALQFINIIYDKEKDIFVKKAAIEFINNNLAKKQVQSSSTRN